MATGLFQPFRIYDMATGLPELSNNDFYCRDYDHDEYIVLPTTANKLLPFVIVFKAANPLLTPSFTGTTFKFVCPETGVSKAITVSFGDFTSEVVGGDRYLFFSAATAFTSSVSIPAGRYYLLIENITVGTAYSFYSETFFSKRNI
jgi:hypothetical protein